MEKSKEQENEVDTNEKELEKEKVNDSSSLLKFDTTNVGQYLIIPD